MPIRKRIIYKLLNELNLDYKELCYVFDDIGIRFVPNYIKVYNAVRYLLNTLEGKQQDALVKLVNNDFQIWPHYRVRLDDLSDEFDCWQFRCNNKQTEKFLIELQKKLKEKERNSALNDFKNSFSK